MYIGTALIEAISTVGITQDELAGRANVTPALINHLCRGNRQASEELVHKLAAALQCEVSITVRFTKTLQPKTHTGYKPCIRSR